MEQLERNILWWYAHFLVVPLWVFYTSTIFEKSNMGAIVIAEWASEKLFCVLLKSKYRFTFLRKDKKISKANI